ncbi:MAG TPA: TFIIB-type zinc ribbon-containing protein [Geobacterales bacterium]|nr:TFIIB-type zinc ribbon-containing protein [Geobacterales bacterium]
MSSCSECGGLLIKSADGNLVCSSCGLVHTQNIFEIEEHKQSPSFLPTIPLGSILSPSNYGIYKDYENEPIDAEKQSSIHQLKKLDDRLKAFEASTLISPNLLNNMSQIANELNLSRMAFYFALKLYLKSIGFLKKNGLRYTTPTVSAATLLVTSRMFSYDKILSLDEVAELYAKHGHRIKKGKIAWCASLISKKVVNKQFTQRYLIKMYLNRIIKILKNNSDIDSILNSRNIDKVTYFISLSDKAAEILDKISDIKLQGKSSLIFAAAIIYAADKEIAKTQGFRPILTHAILEKIAGIPEFSLREHKAIVRKYGCKN